MVGKCGERPDLACFDLSGEEHLLIEIKFHSKLGANQPETYLKRLPDIKPSAVLVIAPARRFEELWPTLKSRVSDDCESFGLPSDFRFLTRQRPGGPPGSGLHNLAALVDRGDPSGVADVLQRVGLQDQQVGQFALLHRPQFVALTQQVGGPTGG